MAEPKGMKQAVLKFENSGYSQGGFSAHVCQHFYRKG